MIAPRDPEERRRLAGRLATVVFLAVLVAVAVRWTVRDEFHPLSIVFYALPPLVAGPLLASSGLLWLAAARPRFGVSACIAGVALSLVGVAGTRAGGGAGETVEAEESDFRLVVWNTRWGHAGWEEILPRIAAEDPDVAILIEARITLAERGPLWEETFPDHVIADPGGGMVVMTRGAMGSCRLRHLGGGSRCAETEVVLPGGAPLSLIASDIYAGPSADRRPSLEALLREIDDRSGRATIVAGDFNTPHDSALFDRYRERFVSAFDAKGTGSLLTWPRPVPLLALDHVWLAGPIAPVAARKVFHAESDHAMLVVDLAMRPHPARAGR